MYVSILQFYVYHCSDIQVNFEILLFSKHVKIMCFVFSSETKSHLHNLCLHVPRPWPQVRHLRPAQIQQLSTPLALSQSLEVAPNTLAGVTHFLLA